MTHLLLLLFSCLCTAVLFNLYVVCWFDWSEHTSDMRESNSTLRWEQRRTWSKRSHPELTVLTALTGYLPYLWQAGCEQHTFKQLSHPLQELIHVWSLQHVHLESNRTSEAGQPPHGIVFTPRVKTRRLFAAYGHFLTQVIKNRPCRVNQPILDYLNQAEA